MRYPLRRAAHMPNRPTTIIMPQGGSVQQRARYAVGKTHLAIMLGYLATDKGYKTRFLSTADLMHMLEAAPAQAATVRRRIAANAYKLVIIDNIG
jgi:hypothetical protein